MILNFTLSFYILRFTFLIKQSIKNIRNIKQDKVINYNETYIKQYRQSPRKVRLVINSIRGKSVERALAELRFIPKRLWDNRKTY